MPVIKLIVLHIYFFSQSSKHLLKSYPDFAVSYTIYMIGMALSNFNFFIILFFFEIYFCVVDALLPLLGLFDSSSYFAYSFSSLSKSLLVSVSAVFMPAPAIPDSDHSSPFCFLFTSNSVGLNPNVSLSIPLLIKKSSRQFFKQVDSYSLHLYLGKLNVLIGFPNLGNTKGTLLILFCKAVVREHQGDVVNFAKQ